MQCSTSRTTKFTKSVRKSRRCVARAGELAEPSIFVRMIEQLEPRMLLAITPVPFQHFTIDNNPGARPLEKTLMDVDGDGKLDAIIGFDNGAGPGGIVWYQFPHSGNPADKWNRYTIASPGGQSYEDMFPYDLNGDGAMDLVASYNGNIVWFENQRGSGGDPTKGPWVMHVIGPGEANELAMGDFDGDGKIDIASYTHIYFQNSATSWTTISSPMGAANTLRGVATFNSGSGLGKIDLVGSSPIAPHDIVWFANPRDTGGNARTDAWVAHRIGPSYFPKATVMGTAFITTDVNGDGREDVITGFGEGSGTPPSGLFWWQAPRNRTRNIWIKHVIDASIQYTHKLVLADMNNDGHLDIVFAEQDQSTTDRVGIYYNVDGTGNKWQLQVLSTMSGHNQAVGDINHDGALDILSSPHGVFSGYNPIEVYMSELKGVKSKVPRGWIDTDIGAAGLPGSANSTDGVNWTVSGSGKDINGTADQFNYVYGHAGPGSILIAKVTSLTKTDASAKSGLLFRASTDPAAAFADVVLTPSNTALFQWRSAAGAPTASASVAGLTIGTWLKLVRAPLGNVFSAFYSSNGTTWTQIGSPQIINMPSTALGGLAATARNNGMLNTAVFTGFSMSGGVSQTSGDLSAPVYFSDQPFTVTSNGSGPPERDRSNGDSGAADGHAITLNGQVYSKGLGVQADSDVSLDIRGANYSNFVADIGVDDEAGSNGNVDFQVWVDGVKGFDSGVMTGASATRSIKVPINGASTLRLVVTTAGNGNTSDDADWANARMIITAPATPTSLKASYAIAKAKINLSWADPANDETGFRIERKAGIQGIYALIADLTAGKFSYSDGSSLTPGVTYYYRVYAYKTGTPNSGYSAEANALVPATAVKKK